MTEESLLSVSGKIAVLLLALSAFRCVQVSPLIAGASALAFVTGILSVITVIIGAVFLVTAFTSAKTIQDVKSERGGALIRGRPSGYLRR